MTRSRHWLIAMAAIALLALFCISACGQDQIPELAEVPSSLPQLQRDALNKQRAALQAEREALKARVDAHNQKLAPKDSPEEQALRAEAEELKAEIQKHLEASRAFNLAVAFARRLHDAGGQGLPVTAPITNDTGHRSAYDYAKVINQFEVEESERYRPGDDTYCNIFAWDVTRAMGAEIPHWVLKQDRGSSAVDKDGEFAVEISKRDELNVNATVKWLKEYGERNGWRRVDARMAQQMAAEGHPAVAVWANPRGGHGHIAMVRPGSVPHETSRGPKGVAIAQAGGEPLVLDATHLTQGFNDPKLRKAVQYWYHD